MDDAEEMFWERAAIMEIDGGMGREDALVEAAREVAMWCAADMKGRPLPESTASRHYFYGYAEMFRVARGGS